MGAFNAFAKMTPRRQSGVETRNGGYKGLESWLVDEGDKKFIRRSVGAAPPRRWRRERRKTKTKLNGEEGVKIKVHCKEGTERRRGQEGNGRENSNC